VGAAVFAAAAAVLRSPDLVLLLRQARTVAR
jgi:hypothetical protein